MGTPTGRFQRSDRIRRSRDYQRISRQGRRTANPDFVLLMADRGPGSDLAAHRLGITSSRKVGNAIVRNRIKRGVREWFRRSRASLPADLDLVVIARKHAGELTCTEMAASIDSIVVRALSRWKT
jgi:ribonuclease P protein component